MPIRLRMTGTYFDDNDPINTYEPLYVDAVVSNPPYSQAWDSSNKESDPRYARFGLAPKPKQTMRFYYMIYII